MTEDINDKLNKQLEELMSGFDPSDDLEDDGLFPWRDTPPDDEFDAAQKLLTEMRLSNESFEPQFFQNCFLYFLNESEEALKRLYGKDWFVHFVENHDEDSTDENHGKFADALGKSKADAIDNIMIAAKAEEQLNQHLILNATLTDAVELKMRFVENGWVVNLSGKNAREREAEMDSYRADPDDFDAEVYRTLWAAQKMIAAATARFKGRIAFLEKFQGLQREVFRRRTARIHQDASYDHNEWVSISEHD